MESLIILMIKGFIRRSFKILLHKVMDFGAIFEIIININGHQDHQSLCMYVIREASWK